MQIGHDIDIRVQPIAVCGIFNELVLEDRLKRTPKPINVMPHIILTVIGVILNAVAWFMSAKWAALTAAILYVVGGVLGFSNLIFLLPSLILFMSVERELYRPFLRYTSVMWVVFFQKWCRMEVA